MGPYLLSPIYVYNEARLRTINGPTIGPNMEAQLGILRGVKAQVKAEGLYQHHSARYESLLYGIREY